MCSYVVYISIYTCIEVEHIPVCMPIHVFAEISRLLITRQRRLDTRNPGRNSLRLRRAHRAVRVSVQGWKAGRHRGGHAVQLLLRSSAPDDKFIRSAC